MKRNRVNPIHEEFRGEGVFEEEEALWISGRAPLEEVLSNESLSIRQLLLFEALDWEEEFARNEEASCGHGRE